MKTIICSTTTQKKKYDHNVTAKVYRIKNNVPILIGLCEWNTGSCKGTLNEVFSFLFEQKLISKKEYNKYNQYYIHGENNINIIEV